MELNELFGKYALGTIRPEDYITWAEQQLIAGIDSPSLPVLAGMDLTRPIDSIEVYEWFARFSFSSIRDSKGESIYTYLTIRVQYIKSMIGLG